MTQLFQKHKQNNMKKELTEKEIKALKKKLEAKKKKVVIK